MPLTRQLSRYIYISSPAPAPTEEDFVWEDHPSSPGPDWAAVLRLLARIGLLLWCGLFIGGLVAFVWFAWEGK